MIAKTMMTAISTASRGCAFAQVTTPGAAGTAASSSETSPTLVPDVLDTTTPDGAVGRGSVGSRRPWGLDGSMKNTPTANATIAIGTNR